MSIGIALVALALGYKVFADAYKEKEGLRLLGQIVGVGVMVLALVSAVCSTMKCMYQAGCPLMSKSNCAMMAKGSSGVMGGMKNCPIKSEMSETQ